MSKSIVLHSGGLDSTTVLAEVCQVEDPTNIYAVSFNYGQKHANRELTAAHEIREWFGCQGHVIAVPIPKGESALMGTAEMPHLTYEELAQSAGPSITYVPFRNGTFLSLSAALALDIGADIIYTGVHAEDARNWAYPDCTPEFVGAMANAIYVGTYHQVRLAAPLQYATKADIVKRALDANAPIHLTVSCYEGGQVACGRCPTCVARLAAFADNNVQDPIEYEFDKYRREGIKPEAVIASIQLAREMGDG